MDPNLVRTFLVINFLILIIVCTLETNDFLVYNKLGYLRYTNIFQVKGSKSGILLIQQKYSFFNHNGNYYLDSAKAWLVEFTERITKE